jgi:hypothetical protein
MKTRRALAFLLVLCGVILPTAFGAKSRVVKEVVLTSYSEDITYIRNGPYAHHVAFLEDMKVVGYPASRLGNDSIKTLFDFSDVQPTFRPNGLAYIESERRFAVVTRSPLDKMMVFDANGRLESVRSIEYPEGYVPNFVEGLGYIPPEADRYPDHLALCTGMINPTTRAMNADILILRRDGTLAHQIPVPSKSYSDCGAVAFQSPDRLLVSGVDGDWSILTPIDFDGHIVGPTSPLFETGIEGTVTLPSGEVLAVGSGGIIYSLDGNLQRQPQRDRHYRPDMGSGESNGLAWDSGRRLFVLAGRPGNYSDVVFALFALPATFTGVTKLADLYGGDAPLPSYTMGRMTYLPDENLIAMRHARRGSPPNPQFVPESILLFRNSDGARAGTIELSGLGLGNPVALAWLPNRNQFAVSFSATGRGEPGIVHLLDRSGSHVGIIDYSATIVGPVTSLAFSNSSDPSGGQLLISTGPTVFVGDLAGNVTGRFPTTDFTGMVSVTDLATVTSGPYAGTFAAIASSRWGSVMRLVLFRVDTP